MGQTDQRRGLDLSLLWRSAVVQGVAVALLSVVLGLVLPDAFFRRWGWLAGPTAWLLCAAVTATFLRLPLPRTLLGAGLAGLPSLGAVALGVHWLGPAMGVLLFGLWCGWTGRSGAGAPARRPLPRWTRGESSPTPRSPRSRG